MALGISLLQDVGLEPHNVVSATLKQVGSTNCVILIQEMSVCFLFFIFSYMILSKKDLNAKDQAHFLLSRRC